MAYRVVVAQHVARIEPERSEQCGAALRIGRSLVREPQHQAVTLAAKRHAGGKCKRLCRGQQGTAQGLGRAGIEPADQNRLPGQFGTLDGQCAVLELGLARYRIAGLVGKQVTPPLTNSAPQCMAMKACPLRRVWSGCQGRIMRPRRVDNSTRSRAAMPRRSASRGCKPTAGSGTWPNRRGARAVRLMPCQWSRSLPVLSDSG